MQTPINEYGEICGYKRLIDMPHAIDIISETYGDVLPLLTDNSYIFGGAIRDVIADMLPLEGDLDIVVDKNDGHELINTFYSCNKIATINRQKASNKYPENLPIISVNNFVTTSGKIVQVIVAENDVLEVPLKVDFTCCGVAMSKTGEVFEIIRGAEKACKQHTLDINKSHKITDVNGFEDRLSKLTNRGWKSKINITKIKKRLKYKFNENKTISRVTAINIASKLVSSNLRHDHSMCRLMIYPAWYKKEDLGYILDTLTHKGLKTSMVKNTIIITIKTTINVLRETLTNLIYEGKITHISFTKSRSTPSNGKYPKAHASTWGF